MKRNDKFKTAALLGTAVLLGRLLPAVAQLSVMVSLPAS